MKYKYKITFYFTSTMTFSFDSNDLGMLKEIQVKLSQGLNINIADLNTIIMADKITMCRITDE